MWLRPEDDIPIPEPMDTCYFCGLKVDCADLEGMKENIVFTKNVIITGCRGKKGPNYEVSK